MRLVAWNVETLKPWLAEHRLATHAIERLGDPDILCLQEIRLRPVDRDDVDAMHRALPGFRCAASLCDDPRNVTFRGGRAYGVATYVRETLGPIRELRPPWDREGRVVCVLVGDPPMAVINLYAVNGTSKAYVDPDTGAARGDRHRFKQWFQDALLTLAAELRRDGDVILAGDWNVSQTRQDVTPRLRTEEPHATARARLVSRLREDGWIDVFRHLDPSAQRYTWFGRTRSGALDAARVDYIVVPEAMLPRIASAEIHDAPEARSGSDHAPISLVLHDR